MNIRSIINFTLQQSRRLIPVRNHGNYIYIIGAQKAGTTSLHFYLAQHPDIISGRIKELQFFNKDTEYSKGVSYYLSHFPVFKTGKYALDATPEYLYYSNAPRRIHAFGPKSKIIILLREPVSRSFSAFNMYKQMVGCKFFRNYLLSSNSDAREFFMPIARGEIDPDVEYFLDREMAIISGNATGEEPALIRRGIYAPQIKRYLDLFGTTNVLVLFSEDLQRRTQQTVDRVFDFLDLPRLEQIELEPQHVRDYTTDKTAKKIIHNYAEALFARDKQELIEKFQLSVPW